MIREDLLQILRCPLNRGPLEVCDEELLGRVNEAIAAGHVANRAGESVTEALDGGLVDAPRSWLYPVRGEIPCLLADEAIPLNQVR